MIRVPLPVNTASNTAANLLSRSRIRNSNRAARWPRSMNTAGGEDLAYLRGPADGGVAGHTCMSLPQCARCSRIGCMPSGHRVRSMVCLLGSWLADRSGSCRCSESTRSRPSRLLRTSLLVSMCAALVARSVSSPSQPPLVIWLEEADAWQLSSGVPLPTVRLLLDDGSGLDFTESAKTKRVNRPGFVGGYDALASGMIIV